MSRFATIYVGCKQLGIEDEDDRRDLFERVTKKRSLKLMTFGEIKQVETELARLGFKKTSKPRSNVLEGAYAKKLQALWIGAWNLGIVKNKSDKALLAFVKRQTGVDHTRFLRHKEDGDKAIEALKAWMAREAGVDWSVDPLLPSFCRAPGYKISLAQWCILKELNNENVRQFWLAVYAILGGNRKPEVVSGRDWMLVMNSLGKRIRAAK